MVISYDFELVSISPESSKAVLGKYTLVYMELDRLIDRHKDAVYRQMVRVCGNHEDAEDALADAILAALRSSEQLRDAENFQAWLAVIGKRSCARSRIRHRLEREASLTELMSRGFEPTDNHPDPLDESLARATKECVAQAVETLPPIYRPVYMRRDIDGIPAEQVSRELGISLPAMKSRLHRARALIREALDTGMGCKGLFSS